MGLSIWQIVLVVILFLLLFGRGKIPALMSDLAEGIKGFKKGMVDDNEQAPKTTPSANESAHNIEKKADKHVAEPNSL
ncbi:twin-arginine translocase TatA/TatE family subunit [Paraglaciecola sp.]|uniref:twin-arginine translocase TatA/TatE family subunit n=1 Tax=Paraglaciecola sp. TaxID=1920173 RepID=UPI0030F39501